MANVTIKARVESRRVQTAREVLDSLGLGLGDYVNMAMAQLVAQRAIPFPMVQGGDAYALAEYGLASKDLAAAAKRINRSIASERKRGTVRRVESPDGLI